MEELSQEVEVAAQEGLHLRPAAKIVALAQRYRSEIMIGSESAEPVDARSLIGLTSLAAGHRSRVVIAVRGDDAAEALSSLVALFERNFED